MEMKYQLPEAEALKEIGFIFKHNTMKDAIKYIKDFVKVHRSEVMEVILPELDGAVYEERLGIIDIFTSPDSAEIIERLSRLKRGIIVKSDYFFVVHPKHKNDKNILIKVWTNRLKKYSVDTQIAMYDQSFMGINDDEAIDLVFYNELLRYFIRILPSCEFNEENDSLCQINKQIVEMKEKCGYYLRTNHILLYRVIILSFEKLIEAKYELLFSSNESTAQKATRIFSKAQSHRNPMCLSECTTVEEKVLVLRHYLKKQTPTVVKSKNTRGSGTNKIKKKKIVLYINGHPDANNTEIAKALGVNRKTVRKYREK